MQIKRNYDENLVNVCKHCLSRFLFLKSPLLINCLVVRKHTRCQFDQLFIIIKNKIYCTCSMVTEELNVDDIVACL